ncbi:CLUMA_CG018740, isoform A [Clunio marinus]|uniref:Elongation of very long chain fatty acids protein n=1 Tax=Clunio marinus TaxID=568069 RepID=A0A1J1J2N3_9DIPT|nr:CLUMA_CG018740, isoform A [Clunio marinus]
MALVLKSTYLFIEKYSSVDIDSRIEHLPFMKNHWTLIGLLAAYLYFVNNIGRKLMENRKPFQLKTVMNIYNLFQIFINGYMMSTVIRHVLNVKNFDILCFPDAKLDNSVAGGKILFGHYLYFIVKVSDLLDTVFFILRKKNNQATFLHIYHHTLMIAFTYFTLKYVAGAGQMISIGFINSIVHVVMYGYYFLTSYKPELKHSIWWKKHITQLQLLQFMILTVHLAAPLFVTCYYPKPVLIVGVLQNFFMMSLFLDFYYKTYIHKKGTIKATSLT